MLDTALDINEILFVSLINVINVEGDNKKIE